MGMMRLLRMTHIATHEGRPAVLDQALDSTSWQVIFLAATIAGKAWR